MALKAFFQKAAALTLIAGAVGGLGYGSLKGTEALNPASKGVTYLQDHGYTDVQGGSVSLFSLCGKAELGRTYTAVNKSGQPVKETVCLGLLWSHKPYLG